MNQIHSTAIVSKKAKIAENVTIGPFVIIEDDVEIGNDCNIGPHVVIYNGARIGNKVTIHQGASVSHVPQDLKFANEVTYLHIGEGTIVHEFVTLHRGTKETGHTFVGKNCLLMAYSHVAHDNVIGDNCILANAVQLAGHVHIENYVILGGAVVVHQFTSIGQHSMVGGGSRVPQDVPPFTLMAGEPLRYAGLNVVGLRRRGFSNDDVQALKSAYSYIFSKSFNVSQALSKVKSEFNNKYVDAVVEFISKSKRGLVGK
jgi:UDP-N-acetylglucosamine acyltransferase